jgi:CrcB protein
VQSGDVASGNELTRFGEERMRDVFYIAGFGAFGCVSRYYLSSWVYFRMGRDFPFGTFAVNVIGAFFIGIIMEFSLRSALISQELRQGLTIGFMGGLTTFSTFSYETFKLLEDGEFLIAFSNVLLSVVVCLIFTWLGIHAARSI